MKKKHFSAILTLTLGVVLGTLLADVASAALVFDAAASSVTFTHDLLDDGSTSRTVTIRDSQIPVGPGDLFALEDDVLSREVKATQFVDSRARAGFGQLTSTLFGTGTVKSGTLVTQTDLDNASEAFSSLTIDFDLHWDVTAPRFGPPILGSFNIPILAVVGAGGEAKAEVIDMHWERSAGGIGAPTDLRAPANVSQTFGPGTTLTALSAPPAAFNPFLLPAGDELIIRGKIKLSTKNANEPVNFYFDLPDNETLVLDSAPVLYHRFADGPLGGSDPGSGTAIDSSPVGGNNDGSYIDTVNFVAGINNDPTNPAASFTNTDGIQTTIEAFTSFTVEGWIASNQPNVWDGGTIFGDDSPNGFSLLAVNGSNQLQLRINNEDGTFTQAANPFLPAATLEEFHHIAMSWDNDAKEAAFYIDGAEFARVNQPALNRSVGTFLDLDFGVDGFNGRLDEFAYYDYVLRPEVIASRVLVGEINPADTPAGELGRIIGATIGEAAVPEPVTGVLCVLGLSALTMRRRRTAN